MEYKIPMRIAVVSPPVGVNFSLENNGNLVSVTQSTGEDITFDFDAVVKPQRNTGVPNFTGAFARGTPAKRFFYVNIGELAGQADCELCRRAKIWISTGYPKSLRTCFKKQGMIPRCCGFVNLQRPTAQGRGWVSQPIGLGNQAPTIDLTRFAEYGDNMPLNSGRLSGLLKKPSYEEKTRFQGK